MRIDQLGRGHLCVSWRLQSQSSEFQDFDSLLAGHTEPLDQVFNARTGCEILEDDRACVCVFLKTQTM